MASDQSPVRAAATKWLEAAWLAMPAPWLTTEEDSPCVLSKQVATNAFIVCRVPAGELAQRTSDYIALAGTSLPAAAKALLVLDEAMERVCAECIDPGVVLILSHAREQAAALCGEVKDG